MSTGPEFPFCSIFPPWLCFGSFQLAPRQKSEMALEVAHTQEKPQKAPSHQTCPPPNYPSCFSSALLPLIPYIPVCSSLRARLQNHCCGCKTPPRLEQAVCDKKILSGNALGQRRVAQVALSNMVIASLLGGSWSSVNTRQPLPLDFGAMNSPCLCLPV